MGDLGNTLETSNDFVSAASTPGNGVQFPEQLATDVDQDIEELYIGLSIVKSDETRIGVVIHDGTYSVDFAVQKICATPDHGETEEQQSVINTILTSIDDYQQEHCCKFLGAGITPELCQNAPNLCGKLWSELDIVPIVVQRRSIMNGKNSDATATELADLAVRDCISSYGPDKQPRITVNHFSEVQVDLAGQVHLTTKSDYQKSVREPTWRAVQMYVNDIKIRQIRIAFFSATPQGGGVASMRHALLRYLRCEGIKVGWYVPRPKSDIFRITKTNHNILRGVAGPDVRSSHEELQSVKTWVTDNAQRFWLKQNGPLTPSSDGGAHVVIVDNPEMSEIVSIAKREEPHRPVIFRSHVEIRDNLIIQEGSPAQEVWKPLWEDIKNADIFISHPVKSFVPRFVDYMKFAWMPATIDWLDGLNKKMRDWETNYYLHLFRQMCQSQGLPLLEFPARPYITQIARFDPSKGIPDLLETYTKLRDMMDGCDISPPQLVICGHASADDPDETRIYEETVSAVNEKYSKYKDDVIVIRLGPSDQMLNAILSKAKVALQLSTRQEFEVKVFEALHKGIPVVTSNPYRALFLIRNGRNGFSVPPGDHEAAAKHLYDLIVDDQLYNSMSSCARDSVSDEVHTVGNALSWLYLISSVTGGKKMEPHRKWMNDLARKAAAEPYEEDEPRLLRFMDLLCHECGFYH